jgi:hypothetical protein
MSSDVLPGNLRRLTPAECPAVIAEKILALIGRTRDI